jgi:hypothetical protein
MRKLVIAIISGFLAQGACWAADGGARDGECKDGCCVIGGGSWCSHKTAPDASPISSSQYNDLSDLLSHLSSKKKAELGEFISGLRNVAPKPEQ